MNAARSRRLLVLAAIAVLLTLAGVGRGQVAHAGTGTTGALRICSSCASTAGDLTRYRYAILNSWDAPMIPLLKAKDPSLKVLVYKNLSFTTTYSCSNGVDLLNIPNGVGYCDANANHPDWFLKDASGNRVASAFFPHAYLMDVGNLAYQDKWLSNVRTDLQRGGWDGVFMDDTDADVDWHLNGRTLAKYPTHAGWRAATRSMLSRLGPAFVTDGSLAIPNFYMPWTNDYDALATWRDWLQFVSGGMQEYYTKWGTTSSSWFATSDWSFRQGFQAATETADKIFIGLTYGPKADARSMRYARANFLLFDDPANGGALMY